MFNEKYIHVQGQSVSSSLLTSLYSQNFQEIFSLKDREVLYYFKLIGLHYIL